MEIFVLAYLSEAGFDLHRSPDYKGTSLLEKSARIVKEYIQTELH